MNATLKNILTSPITIGSAILGIDIATSAFIWGKKRPKTEAEIELMKMKEINAEAERQRQHELSVERIKAKQALDAVEAEEATKRAAKHEEEVTKRAETQLAELKERHEWERTLLKDIGSSRSPRRTPPRKKLLLKRSTILSVRSPVSRPRLPDILRKRTLGLSRNASTMGISVRNPLIRPTPPMLQQSPTALRKWSRAK